MAAEFKATKRNLEIVLKVALSSHGNTNLKNIHVSCITLMCEVGFEEFERLLLTDIIAPLQVEMGTCKENPGK